VNTGSERPPRFAIGEGYAVYRGPTTSGTVHRHAAFQIVIGKRARVAIVDASKTRHESVALVVPPMEPHRLLATPDVLTYFVEPHCAFADELRERHGVGITAAPELDALTEDDIRQVGIRSSSQLDARLVEALNALDSRSIPLPIVAAEVGLSAQRLRALARSQLGMPLSRWRVWTRLRRAAEALQAGRSLADAASTAGFADQAHLTRQMREMMGLTPAAVLPLLRSQALRPT
jgi:AraC-like DNA-binding protein